MTDGTNLTPGGEMNDNPAVAIRPTDDGYLVEWSKGAASGTLGPYNDEDTAQKVMDAKRQELIVNDKPA